MELYKLSAHKLKELIDKKEVTVTEVVTDYINRIKSVDGKLNAYLYSGEEEALKKAAELDKKILNNDKLGGLGGIPVSIKDNIAVDGMQLTCASKILDGYISPYDAHVVKRIKEEDGIILGKLNMDEFAMGSSTETSHYKITKNPWDTERIPGGSSGGSVVSVASSETALSLGTDTGGSVRQPAALCGVVGLKPTYGRVSRYGAVAFGSTLDCIGPIARDVEDCAMLAQYISGLDKMDSTTADVSVPDYKKSLSKDLKGKKIGLPKEYFEEGLDENVRKAVEEAVKVLKENGAEVEECSLPLSQYSLAAYYIIASAEASSNLARFDGIKYGYRTQNSSDSIEIYSRSRGEGFGSEVKRRIMLGTYVLSAGYYDAYYKKALKVRNLIKQDFAKVFSEFDAVISPTSPTTAFKIGERMNDVLAMYLSDIYTVPANIAGIPGISVPCGMVNNLPVGLQILSNYFREDILFNVAYSFEQSTNWHEMMPNV